MQEKGNKGGQFVKLLLLLVLAAVTVAAFVFTNQLFGEDSVFNKAVSGNNFVNLLYQKIPALIRSVQIVTVAVLLSLLLRFIMRKGFARSNRAKTIVNLLESFVKWVIAIVAIMMVLHAWGVDTATLLASTGILTLIVGLGAESLVADIVAGIFMVFEGEFQVGDIVIINDWRGTVQEIGIRTTKIVDAGGNINIVNNSQITTVVNQTQEILQAPSRWGWNTANRCPASRSSSATTSKRSKSIFPPSSKNPIIRAFRRSALPASIFRSSPSAAKRTSSRYSAT